MDLFLVLFLFLRVFKDYKSDFLFAVRVTGTYGCQKGECKLTIANLPPVVSLDL